MLVESRACVRGPLFANIPSPFAIASKMELNEIVEVLDPSKSDEEDDDIAFYDTVFKRSSQSVTSSSNEYNNVSKIERGSPGFITGIVGDVGTCKTNRGVMSRSNGYSWVGVIPGDLHIKGYFVESCFKGQGLGGFHYLVSKILKRPIKAHLRCIQKKKFAEGNLDRIREAVLERARAYGLAAVWEFKKSNLYPTEQEMMQCLRATGSHLQVLLEKFKLWLNQSSRKSVSFKYGPLLELFDLSTKHCWGKARETCFILQLPIYAQLNFKNYYTEVFIHLVNLLGKWPLAFRQLLANNGPITLVTKIFK